MTDDETSQNRSLMSRAQPVHLTSGAYTPQVISKPSSTPRTCSAPTLTDLEPTRTAMAALVG